MAKKITICPNPNCRRVITNPSIKKCPHCGTSISPTNSIGLSEETIYDNNHGSKSSHNPKKKPKNIPEQSVAEDFIDDDYGEEEDTGYTDETAYEDEDPDAEDSDGYEDDDYYEDENPDSFEDDDDYEDESLGAENSGYYEDENPDNEDSDYFEDEDPGDEAHDGYGDDDYYEDENPDVETSEDYAEDYEDDDFSGEEPEEQRIDKNSIDTQATKPKTRKRNNFRVDTSLKHEDVLSAKDSIPHPGINNSEKMHTSIPFAIDPHTGLIVREDLKKLLATTDTNSVTVVSLKINYLEDTYDSLGKTCGDRLLTAVASNLQSLFPNRCCQFTKDRIIVILNNIDDQNLNKRIKKLNRDLNTLSDSDTDGILYDVSIGVASGDGILTKQEILKAAGNRMMESYSQSQNIATASESTPETQEEFNPNYDHYYDEVLPAILEEVDRIPFQSILKVVFSLVFLLAVIVYLILFL